MRRIHSALLAGLAAVAFAGAGAMASDAKPVVHEMTIRLPGGGVGHIRYAGDVAPQITVRTLPWGLVASPFAFDAPFADFDRMSQDMAQFSQQMDRMRAEMDRRVEIMNRQAETLMRMRLPDSDALIEAGLGSSTPGSTSYSVVSTSSSDGTCTRTVQVTAPAGGGKPQVVSHESGACGHASATARERPDTL